MTEEEKIKRAVDLIRKNNKGETIDFVVPRYAAKKIIAFQSMREDLLLCKDAITELLKKNHTGTIEASLFYTIVILYGKCFTDASSSKSPKLEPTLFDKNHLHLIQFHNEIMEMRHNLVAHRGKSEHDFGFPYLSLGIKDLSRQVRVKQLKRNSFSQESLNSYFPLIEFLISVVEEKFKKAGTKAWNHLIENFPPEKLVFLKIAGPKVD